MADPKFNSLLGTSGRQKIAVGGLALVLAVVLKLQFGGGGSPPAEATAEPGQAEAPVARRGARSLANKAWPTIPLAATLDHDPFLLSRQARQELAAAAPPAPEPADDARDQIVAELQATGVTALFRDAKGTAAVMGNRVVRVGDRVGGYRITAIDPTGVTLDLEDVEEAE